MKDFINKVVTAIRIFFKALDVLDLVVLFVLTVMVIVAVPYGIIHKFIEPDQRLLAILFSIFLLVSIVSFIMYFRGKLKIVLCISLASLCLLIGIGLFLVL